MCKLWGYLVQGILVGCLMMRLRLVPCASFFMPLCTFFYDCDAIAIGVLCKFFESIPVGMQKSPQKEGSKSPQRDQLRLQVSLSIDRSIDRSIERARARSLARSIASP